MTQKNKGILIAILIFIPLALGLIYIFFINRNETLTGYWALRIIMDNADVSYQEDIPSKMLYFTDEKVISSICIDDLIQQKYDYKIEDDKITYTIDNDNYYYHYLLNDELTIRTLAGNETFEKITEAEYLDFIDKCE